MERNEMAMLMELLKREHIPFDVRMRETPYAKRQPDGNYKIVVEVSPQIVAPSADKHEIDAICDYYSYGGSDGLLEIMGNSRIIGAEDRVRGWLTAEQAFEYFKKWWDDKCERS